MSVMKVLIEPYWNVNKKEAEQRSEFCYVLIEPYWNVNDQSDESNGFENVY